MPSTVEPQDWFGYALAVGDFDGNGHDDLAIGVPGETVFSVAGAGVVNVVYNDGTGLNPSWAARPAQEFHQDSANVPDTAEAGDHLGAALAAGDFDNSRAGTTRDDLAIGIPGEDIPGISPLVDVGAVLVIYSSGTSGLVAGPNTDLLVPRNPVGLTSAEGPGEQFGTVLAAGRFNSGSTEDDLAWGGLGQRFDGAVLRSGATLTSYSGGSSGVNDGTVEGFDAWLLEGCDNEPLPLYVALTNGTGKIWNVKQGTVWNYEGRPYDVPISGEVDDFSRVLSNTLCTAHFRIYYADQGESAVTHEYAIEMARLLEEGWTALVRQQGFRDPVELEADGRYNKFRGFRRIPVLIYTTQELGNDSNATGYPLIRLSTHINGWQTPAHEFFHEIYHGYTKHKPGWLNEGLARWSQQFLPNVGTCCAQYHPDAYRALHHDYLTRKYCDTAPWFQYLGRQYTADGDGSDVIRAILEEMAYANNNDEDETMFAFERALDRFEPSRDSGYGNAFAEWAAGNYVNDTVDPSPMRTNAPLFPRYLEGGRVGPGGNRYLFREYTFTLSRTDTVTIQVRASAGDLDGNHDDDDLRLLLDGAVLGDWNSFNSFDGETLQGRIRTLHIIQPNVGAGPHVLRLEADEQPILYSLTVFEGEVPLLVQSSAEARPSTVLSKARFRSYTFETATDVTNFTVYVTGVASNVVQNGAEDVEAADNTQLQLDGTNATTWSDAYLSVNEDLDGHALQGELATVEIHLPSTNSSSHTLTLYADGRPLIREIVVFPTPEQPPLLQVRTIKLVPWSAGYQVVPVTQALIDSADALRIGFEHIDWTDDLNPPFTEMMNVSANGAWTGSHDRQQRFSRWWDYSADALTALGATGRLVHVTTATHGSGTYELVVRRVPDANNAPVLAVVPDRTAPEAQALRFTVSASDPDVPANHLTYSLALDAPTGPSIGRQTGEFSWTPSEIQGPGVYNLTVYVTDDGSLRLSDSATFRVTVTEVNEPPRVNPIADRSVREGEAVSLGVTATDPDVPMNALSSSLGPNAPGGMTLNAQSGWLQWIPNEAQGPGTYPITVLVTDNGTPNRTGSNVFTVTVAEVNQAPSLAAIADRTLHAGATLSFTVVARDFDLPPDTLSFHLVNPPVGVSLDATTGQFSWTPTDGQAGASYPLTVEVTDNGNPSLSDTKTISVTVASRPVITAVRLVGERIQLTWTSIAGQRYRLQYQSQLGTGPWTDLPGEVGATADSTTAEDVSSLTTQRFYRVQVLP
jgi:hypothetical protein